MKQQPNAAATLGRVTDGVRRILRDGEDVPVGVLSAYRGSISGSRTRSTGSPRRSMRAPSSDDHLPLWRAAPNLIRWPAADSRQA
jgi:hypothetical protein